MYKTLDGWCGRNDFVTTYTQRWVVDFPIGYTQTDNLLEVRPIDIYNQTDLKWFFEWNARYKQNRDVLVHWMRQTKRI